VLFDVAAQEKSDWELRVLIDGKQIHKQTIDRTGGIWKQVKIDLTSFAGKKVVLRLENFANDWNNEFGYWSDVKFGATPF
jgi:hypothetical protein